RSRNRAAVVMPVNLWSMIGEITEQARLRGIALLGILCIPSHQAYPPTRETGYQNSFSIRQCCVARIFYASCVVTEMPTNAGERELLWQAGSVCPRPGCRYQESGSPQLSVVVS